VVEKYINGKIIDIYIDIEMETKRRNSALTINIQGCKEWILNTYPATTTIIKWWTDKGYSFGYARNMTSRCYRELAEMGEKEREERKNRNLLIYEKIIEDCRANGEYGYMLKAMERIDKISGIEAPTQIEQKSTLAIDFPDEVYQRAKELAMKTPLQLVSTSVTALPLKNENMIEVEAISGEPKKI
jgi:hypothetical protein